ncbi:phosphotransferase [Shewanella sp. FJAT-52076]|uniref:phosphotransferase n=1 Tax=Shewanella sp. FJAT-52076 TaxID=2864202 RepID=UPI001C66128F|nr:phosphotransferase [Shewanella sp. FJAT-52076]QYJ76682.1 serine/threonine protein phosphatase [Shewanella sp. FJAT-52076]
MEHDISTPATSSLAFKALVAEVLATHQGHRVVPFDFEGRRYWLKQPERLEGAMKLLKHSPDQALQTEIRALQTLNEKHAPVPNVVLAGEGYFVIEDAGKTVSDWWHLSHQDGSVPFDKILTDSAAALAELHSLELAHGRPALRDIGWQGGAVKFIDFEANQRQKDMAFQQRRDLLVYLHSLYRYLGPAHEPITRAMLAYREAGGEPTWQAAKRKLAPWQWLRPLLKPFRSIGGRDLKPMYWVMWHFHNQG